jgi:hypothetical protein
MRDRIGTPKAMTAAAHELAGSFTTWLRTSGNTMPPFSRSRSAELRTQKRAKLYSQAKELGLQLLPVE